MRQKKYVIWSDYDIDPAEWDLDELEDYYGDGTDAYGICVAMNYEYLDDERANLNIALDEPILAIADLGLWDGRRSAYKIIKGNKISDCLYSECDYCEWYVDELGDFRLRESHHDGTNFILYREFKPNTSEEQRENLMNKIYMGKATRSDITRITRKIGDRIADVYGWQL